jgi:hypothetical protein
LPAIKPPFLDQPAIHFATTLTELVSLYCIKASRTLKNSSFKDYKILKDNNTIFSFIWITGANTKRKLRKGKENIFPDSSRNYNTQIKKGIKMLQRKWKGTYNHSFR